MKSREIVLITGSLLLALSLVFAFYPLTPRGLDCGSALVAGAQGVRAPDEQPSEMTAADVCIPARYERGFIALLLFTSGAVLTAGAAIARRQAAHTA